MWDKKAGYSPRVAGHRAKAKLTTSHNLPLYKHFRQKEHDFEKDATFSVLEKTTKSQLLARESYWINTLSPPWTQPEI